MIGALHEALKPCTVAHAEHVPELVCCNFDEPLESPAVLFLFALIFLTYKVFSKPSDALNSTKGWNSIAVAEIAKVFCEEINVSYGENSDAARDAPVLDWCNHILQNSNSIVLSLIKTILLRAKF